MLTLWFMQDRPYGDERRLADAVTRRFDAMPGDMEGMPVRIRVLAWRQAWSSIRTAFFDGSLPDILEVGSTWQRCLGELGSLVPYMPARPDDKAGPNLPEAFPAGFTIPWTRDVRLLYFRRSLLAGAGIRPGDLATWHGWEAACRRIAENGSTGALGLAGEAEPTLVHTAAMWIWAAGGDLPGPGDRTAPHFGNATLEGLRSFLEWARCGWIPASALVLDTVSVLDAFRNGAYGFLVASTIGPASRLLDDPDVGAVPVPISRCSAATTYEGGTSLAVTQGAIDPEAAWAAVRSLLARIAPDREESFRHAQNTLKSAMAELGRDSPAGWPARLRTLPDLPDWPLLEDRLALALSQWLRRASQQGSVDLRSEFAACLGPFHAVSPL